MPAFLLTEERVLEALRQVIDPELGENVVDLGLIYGVEIAGGYVSVAMTLTTPGCPLHASLSAAVERAIQLTVPGVERVEVELVFDPPWTPERLSATARRNLGWEG